MAERTVRVMSYNIHHGRTLWESRALHHIRDVIRAEDAEVVALQEVDRGYGRRSSFLDQSAWLAQELGMASAFAVQVDKVARRAARPDRPERRQAGTAILSRHPLLRQTGHHMRSLASRTVPAGPHGLLEVMLDVGGVELSVATMHLDVYLSRQRQREAAEAVDITSGISRPLVLMGDFNASPRSPELRLLTKEGGFADVFGALGLRPSPTLPGVLPLRRVDYILTRGDIRATHAHVSRSLASDHLPVIADLTLSA